MVFDQGEGSDILDAIIAEGRCRTCGTPWGRVVKVNGKRPVKIEGGCPNEVCILGTGEPLPPQAPIPPPLLAEVRQAHEEALVAGATPEAIVPPGQP